MTLSRILRLLPVLFAVFWFGQTHAGLDVRVVGLFSSKAVLQIDGHQYVLGVGETSPQGVKLVSANSEAAVLLIDGEKITARLDGRVTARKRSPSNAVATREVQVWRNTSGMYTTVGSINGLPVSFLVDTGATDIALNSAQARRLGIDYRVSGKETRVSTASDVVRAWSVVLDSVKVGELEVRYVDAVVLEGAQPRKALLGMSFLGRMKIVNDGRLMTLQKKY